MFMSGLRGASANRDVPALTILHTVNAEVAALWGKPLMPNRELGYMARSIERYRAKWARHGHCPRWLSRQAARGRKGGRPRLYEPDREPWTLVGVSRATWYRRRKRETKANTDIPPGGGRTCSPPFPEKENDMSATEAGDLEEGREQGGRRLN